jgi:hypothetical protein
MKHWSDQETDNPLLADDRNYYKVQKWTKDGAKIDRMLYAGNNLDKARLIGMADAWRDLAERSRTTRADWRTTDHPLVQETFRSYRG